MKLLIFAVFCLLSGAQAQVSWSAQCCGRAPANAILAGQQYGSQVFSCRANVSGNLLSGKLVVGQSLCHIPWGNRESTASNYDVAVGSAVWRRSNAGVAPPACAALVGFDTQRRSVFACRASHQTFLIPGRIDAGTRRCMIGWNNREFVYDTYDVMCNP